jgi:hypothetical protein
MSLPPTVMTAWNAFAHYSPFASMGDKEWAAYTNFVVACHGAGLGYADVEELLLEGTGVDGAPDFISGELAAGLEVGLRVLAHLPAEDPAAKALREKQEAARVAAASRDAAMAKLSPEERKALGL